MMKKKNTFTKVMRNKQELRFESTPFLTLNKNRSDILNHEILSLILLSNIVKTYQLEFLNPNNEINYEFDFVIDSLKNLKNKLNNSLKRQIEERDYLFSKVNLHLFK
jgi:hypothetical protein